MKGRAFLKRSLPFSFLLLSACTAFSPKQDYLDQPQHDLAQVSDWQSLENTSQVMHLNDLFTSPQVDQLLQQAFADNPSLQQTLITLDIRRAQLQQTSATQRPHVNAGFNVTKQEDSDDRYSSSLSISWQVDLWGKLDDLSQAASLDIAEQEMLLQSAHDSLAANIMQSWLNLIAQQRDIDIQQQRVDALQQNEIFILHRYRNGIGQLEDLDSARSSLASEQANLAFNQELFQQQNRALKTLVGQISNMDLTIPEQFPDVELAVSGLPAQTLARRPDLKAAYLAIESSTLNSKAAYKDLLPSLSIEAMLEDIASSPREALFVSPIWSLLGQLTAPLYQGGELRATAEIFELETALSYQSYRDTLLTAVSEVENAIGQEQSLQTQNYYIETALASAKNNLVQYQQNYRTGLVDILDLLAVQQQTYDLESQLNTTQYNLLANRITLALALGLEMSP
ncbi:MAG: TolC family protein [Piscirickettsiaceae bacterium]|nr:TolC family protein [Piscirickettsiaceae bacterium]